MMNLVFYRDSNYRVCFEPPTKIAQPRFALKLDNRGSVLSSTLDVLNCRYFTDEEIERCKQFYIDKYAREDAVATEYASIGEPRGFCGYRAE